LTSKIKEAIFYVFREEKLPPIRMNASHTEINNWKKSSEVKRCYNNLNISTDGDSATYIMKIAEKVFTDLKKTTDTQLAYTMCVCDCLLNPENESIQITESMIEDKLKDFLVSFAILYS